MLIMHDWKDKHMSGENNATQGERMAIVRDDQFVVDAKDFIIQKGIASKGKNVGKPYEFAKMDMNLSNSTPFIAMLERKGSKVFTQGEGSDNAPATSTDQ